MNPAEHIGRQTEKTPEIVFSMGDPNGIGPEITLKALHFFLGNESFHPIIAGDSHYLRSLGDNLSIDLPWDRIEVIEAGRTPFTPDWGKQDKTAGRLALSALEIAAETCRSRDIPLLVTAPVNKGSLLMAGFEYPGQTEFLAHAFSSENFCMAFLSDSFHLLLATIHISLSRVPELLNQNELFEKCVLFREALIRLNTSPRIAVCGLNPHASENGVFGDEEKRIIVPAIEKLKEKFGENSFSGPFPPDTVFNKTISGEFDAVVAMYHDQGLIPLKLLAFDSAVNTTLGLPVFRTSPGHGTAFDIAGRNMANPDSMIAAVKWGIRLAYTNAETENIHVSDS